MMTPPRLTASVGRLGVNFSVLASGEQLVPKQCPKCGYANTGTEPAALVECPQCKLIYSKYDPAIVRRSEEATRKRVEEQRKVEQEAIEAQHRKEEQRQLDELARRASVDHKDQVVIKTYKGSQSAAAALFQADATKMAAQGYVPTSQTWAPGAYGCGSFLVALALCVVLIGIVIFIYMALVKPDGILSVTYELRAVAATPTMAAPTPEKICPQCAEQVKAAARVCRFCGHTFA